MNLPCQLLLLAILWLVTFPVSDKVKGLIPVSVYNCLSDLKTTSCFPCAADREIDWSKNKTKEFFCHFLV